MSKDRLNKGSTLVEVLVSIAVVLILLVAAASTLLSSRFMSSYSKHKIQAAYLAQQLFEIKRRALFTNIVSVPETSYSLDTNGTYNSITDDLTAKVTFTVTSLNNYLKKVQMKISWVERLASGVQITINEYYATSICDDAVPN